MAGLALCGYGIIQLVSPAQYAATVKIKVESLDAIIVDGTTPSSNVYYDPYFIQTTFELLHSQLVLSNVVATLNLKEAWGKKYSGGTALKMGETMNILKGRMKLAPIRNTKMIAITIYSEDPKEAAQLANAVAEAYKDYRVQNYKRTMATGLAFFLQQFHEEESRISVMETNLNSLRGELKITENQAAERTPEQQPYWDQKREIKSDSPSDRPPEQRPYWDKKRGLDQVLEKHKSLGLKITAQEIDMKIPTTSMVQIIDPALPPSSPVAPNRFLAALMTATGIFLIIAGLMWLKSADEAATSS